MDYPVDIFGEWYCGRSRGAWLAIQAGAPLPPGATLEPPVAQVAACRVAGRVVLILFAPSHPPDAGLRPALVRELRARIATDARVMLCLECQPGAVTLAPLDDPSSPDPHVAAAAAVVAAGWAWDESAFITVTEGATIWSAAPSFDGATCSAAVTLAPGLAGSAPQ